MPWNPRQEPAGESGDLRDHRTVFRHERDVPGNSVGAGPNDPTVAVGDGRGSTHEMNSVYSHRNQIPTRSLVHRCDQAVESAIEQHRVQVVPLCVHTLWQRQAGEDFTRGPAQRADSLEIRAVAQASLGE